MSGLQAGWPRRSRWCRVRNWDQSPRARRRKNHPRGAANQEISPFAVRLVARCQGCLEIFHHIHVSELSVDADYGLNDPAETGQLSGLLMPLQYAHLLPRRVSLNLRPDFTQSCLKGTLTAGIHVTVAAFFIPIMRFGWRAFGPVR